MQFQLPLNVIFHLCCQNKSDCGDKRALLLHENLLKSLRNAGILSFWNDMQNITKRVLVDMSLTMLHHGHIRLLQKVSLLGHGTVALCSDKEIYKAKGFFPQLTFENRREIALAIRYVAEVVECNWLIDEAFLDFHNIDLLVDGADNLNPIPPERLGIFPKTEGVSSSALRGFEYG
jgi:glycerol-3-phosphate cytidylyltransferase